MDDSTSHLEEELILVRVCQAMSLEDDEVSLVRRLRFVGQQRSDKLKIG